MSFNLSVIRVSLICIALLLGLPGGLVAQKTNQLLKLADKAFFNRDYNGAIQYYTKVLSQDKDNLKAQYRLGYSYLGLRETDKALPMLTEVYKTTDEFNPEIMLILGQAHHLIMSFDSAIIYYRDFRRYVKDDDYDAKDAVDKYIEECRVGKVLVKNPVQAKIENLGPGINSGANDYVPLVTPDEKLMVFTSRRQENIGTAKDENNEPYEDIYFSIAQNGKFTEAKNIGAPVNTPRHDACVAISADGKTLYVYKDVNGGDIYFSKKNGNTWTEPVSLGPAINSRDYEPSLSVSDDGNYVFFSSNRPGGVGGLDLYVSQKQPDGTWGEALNLGPGVNTEYDDDAPFIHSATNTLYFSSRGPKSMGGYDVFKTQMKEVAWGTPQNLGVPINTPDNDINFTLPANPDIAYYASTRPGGLGKKDIYKISFQPVAPAEPEKPAEKTVEPEKPVAAAQPPKKDLLIIKGVVKDAKTMYPVAASVAVISESGAELGAVKSDSLTGRYQLTLPTANGATLRAMRKGYLIFSENIKSPAESSSEVTHNIGMRRIQTGANVVLGNIYFELNKALIQPAAYPQLDELYTWLEQNPKVRIEIGGHTDNQGSAEGNRKLSEQRALAVYNYLVNKGIDKDRIVAKGYGPGKPLAGNETETGRSKNRRTDFTILPN